MKNDEKIDINFSQNASSDDISTEEKHRQTLATYKRYINIAEHMKQWEDIDKYYYRAYNTLNKDNEDGSFSEMIDALQHKRFTIRGEGKIALYEEACHVRDTATTEQDYYAAQTIFLRIAKFEVDHKVTKKWVPADLYKRAQKCGDSVQQAEYCEQMAMATSAKERRQSLILSFIIVLIVIAALAFSRTTECRRVLAKVYEMTGSYTSAYQKYNAVYERTGEAEAFDKYLENRYKAAKKALEDGNLEETAYEDMKAVAQNNYEDSQELFTAMEIDHIKSTELGEKVEFACMDWRVLDIQDDKALLIKDNSMGSTAFNSTAGPCTWASSSVRQWLNNDFLTENFCESEQNKILETSLTTVANTYYTGVDAGEATTDKLFLLSIDEEEKYFDTLHETKSCWWLRTPGAAEGSMAFVYKDKQVMAYGYDVTNTEITVKPAMWVSIK